MPDKILQVIPQPAGCDEIGRWLWALAEVRQRTLKLADDCDQQTLDWTSDDGENCIGTLLYHIAIVEMSWLYLDLLRQEFPEDVQYLLPLPVADENRRPSPLIGASLIEHVSRLHATREITVAILREMDAQEWRRLRPPIDGLDYEVTPEWAVFHLIEHEAGHAAQISSLKARSQRHFESHDSK